MTVRKRLLASLFWAACLTASAGSISYPALGNLDLAEGTIEVWFTPMTELYYQPAQPADSWFHGAFVLFSLDVPESFRLACTWFSKAGGKGDTQHLMAGLVGSLSPSATYYNVVASAPLDWQPGEPHYLAFAWQGSQMRIHADTKGGTALASGLRQQPNAFGGRLNGVELVVGSEKTDRIVVHAIRVSSVARPEAALLGATPVKDLYTLLLDRFQTVDAAGTVADQTSGLKGEQGGRFAGPVSPVTAPRPGLALYSVDNDKQ